MGKLTKGLTLGAIVGFFTGMLFAPEKGDETRKKVSDVIEKGKEKLKKIQDQWTKKEE